VHEEGFQIEHGADGELTFRNPRGWSIPDMPDPPALSRDPMDVIWEENLRQRIYPDAHTLTPEWCGERVDVGWAIDVLHPLANPLPSERLGGPAERLDRPLEEAFGDTQLTGEELGKQSVA
jgi:hypothetical protein